MSSNNEINFGPVFMRGRKPLTGSIKPPPATPSSNSTGLMSHTLHTSGGPIPVLRPPIPSLGSFSPGSLSPALPLPKSFSAAVSPEKEAEDRLKLSGASNGWDPSHGAHDHVFVSKESSAHAMVNGTGAAIHEYSRETLLNLYSEEMALELPGDLEIGDPAISETFVGPPLGLVEMTEAEKELFSGSFHAERRNQPHKAQHHDNMDHTQTMPLSPDGGTGSLVPNRLSVGNGGKIAKHQSPIERFTNLGIQGGVLAGVASPTHGTNRRRGDSENDPPEGVRRFPRTDEPASQAPGWQANARDRRARDSGPPTDGKWKRGVPLEEKMHLPTEGVSSNHRYSVLDRMREKAAASLDSANKVTGTQLIGAKESSGSAQPPPDSFDRGPSSQLTLVHDNVDSNKVSQDSFRAQSPTKQDPSLDHGQFTESHASVTDQHAATSQHGVSSSPSNPPDAVPEDIAWQYRDPTGTVQGPFTAFQMQEWYKASFFRDDLLVKRVSDIAFETLETLLLRIGDRDRPFLARPPPALPPNLPLPMSHVQSFQTTTKSQPSPITQRSTLLEQSSFPSRQESLSVFDSPISAHHHDSNSLHAVSAPDPWNSTPQSVSPLHRSGTLPPSSPLASASAWNVGLPALPQPPQPQNHNDYNPSLIGNGFLPNSFTQSDALRFMQHVPHPALMAGNNGYPYPLPMPHQPAFGQIPVGHHLLNGAGLDPILNPQLHHQLGFPAAPYRGNTPMNGNGDPNDVSTEHDRLDQSAFTQPSAAVDPWQAQPESLTPLQTQPLDAVGQHGPVHNVDLSSPTKRDSWTHPLSTTLEPIGTRSSGKSTPTLVLQDLGPISNSANQLGSDAMCTQSPPDLEPINAPPASPVIAPAAVPGAIRSSAPVSSNEVKTLAGFEDTQVKSVPAARTADKANAQPADRHSQVEVISTIDEPWQNVAHHPSTKAVSTPGVSVAAPAPGVPPLAKQSGKVLVISRAQQDEQDRRTASIQKTQLQLKEAQAVERAAREASEAAAAAATASVSAPAPWSKEDNKASGVNLSLMEIQAIEAKQSEKRRQAEKQAAASRALAEQVAAAERASKMSKESLPPTSNWAAASSPTKPTVSLGAPVVWGSKESDGTVGSGPKQTMKQIQEEEARRKKLAQQQLANKATASGGLTRPSGGYAGTVAAKTTVSGPWSVVGAKSKVTALPANGGRPISTASVVPGLPATGRLTSSATHSSISKTPALTTTVRANIPISNSAIKVGSSTSNIHSAGAVDGPPPASPEFMKWLREALRGMNNVDDFMKMLLDFPINPDESVLEIVSDSVYAGSATLDGRRFAKEFNIRRNADVMARMNNSKPASTRANSSSGPMKKASTMADAVKSQPALKNDGWGFAVVGAKKKKK